MESGDTRLIAYGSHLLLLLGAVLMVGCSAHKQEQAKRTDSEFHWNITALVVHEGRFVIGLEDNPDAATKHGEPELKSHQEWMRVSSPISQLRSSLLSLRIAPDVVVIIPMGEVDSTSVGVAKSVLDQLGLNYALTNEGLPVPWPQ